MTIAAEVLMEGSVIGVKYLRLRSSMETKQLLARFSSEWKRFSANFHGMEKEFPRRREMQAMLDNRAIIGGLRTARARMRRDRRASGVGDVVNFAILLMLLAELVLWGLVR